MTNAKHSNNVYTSSASAHHHAAAHNHVHHSSLERKANKVLKKAFKKAVTAVLICFTLFSAVPLTGFDTHGNHFTPITTSQNVKQGQIWNRVRSKFRFKKSLKNSGQSSTKSNSRIEKFVKQYHNNASAVQKFANASPYIYYIIEELEKRDMPGELALLPMLESSYQPTATSPTGAAGLWQFTKGTGRHFNLKQNDWYDARRDIQASTHAALNYLEYLHKKFHGDWMLALAAYNAGEGTVQKAISHKKRAGGPVSYWSLSLSKETQAYVPKLLAMVEVVEHPNLHKISLPRIDNRPYFVELDLKQALPLKQVAKLAELDVKDVKCLNAAYKKGATPPNGHQHLLLPKDNATTFLQNLGKDVLA